MYPLLTKQANAARSIGRFWVKTEIKGMLSSMPDCAEIVDVVVVTGSTMLAGTESPSDAIWPMHH